MVPFMRLLQSRWCSRLALGFALALVLGTTSSPAQTERRVIRIKAERFAFSPSEIVLSEGESVEFRIKSDDTVHGFHIAGTEVDVAVPKRGQGELVVLFTAPKAGRHQFECTRMCGAGHDFMRGVLVVKPKAPEVPAR
jgi:cytochrome c oxidase subunit 2